MGAWYYFGRCFALRVLPERVLRWLKKRHYLGILGSISLEEEPELKVVQYLIEPGDFVIDVGSNFGLYTKVFSDLVGRKGKVYSIEPIPQTFDILRWSIGRLNITNVTLMNVAASNCSSKVIMEVPLWTSGGENYYRARIKSETDRGGALRRVYVETATLDGLVKEKKKVTFVKCDVEGHELACIEGARSLLQKSNAAWLIEVSGDPDDTGCPARQLFDLFQDNGYMPWYIDGTKLKRRRNRDRSTNYFFLNDRHIRRLRRLTADLMG